MAEREWLWLVVRISEKTYLKEVLKYWQVSSFLWVHCDLLGYSQDIDEVTILTPG
jgi:hypothetical protein